MALPLVNHMAKEEFLKTFPHEIISLNNSHCHSGRESTSQWHPESELNWDSVVFISQGVLVGHDVFLAPDPLWGWMFPVSNVAHQPQWGQMHQRPGNRYWPCLPGITDPAQLEVMKSELRYEPEGRQSQKHILCLVAIIWPKSLLEEIWESCPK